MLLLNKLVGEGLGFNCKAVRSAFGVAEVLRIIR
jgi:hypothetical protein